MPQKVALEPGDPGRIGRFTMLSCLARGGQGVVYFAEDDEGRPVVVKVLCPDLLGDPTSRVRQIREVVAARQVASFCTAVVIEADLNADLPYIVSEFVDGPTLYEQVRDDGPITGTALIRLAIGMATAIAAIHRAGVVHRDVKPANVILGPDGPRVIDFGIAKETTVDLTTTGVVMGTPGYIAPEQFEGDPVGPPVDIFALAATVVFAATGRPPHSAPSMAALAYQVLCEPPDLDGVPDGFRPLLLRCLGKNPDRRPTADQVLMSLLDGVVEDQSGQDAVLLAYGIDRGPLPPVPKTEQAPVASFPWTDPTPMTAQPMTFLPVQGGNQGSHIRTRSRARVLLAVMLAVLIVGGVIVAGHSLTRWGQNSGIIAEETTAPTGASGTVSFEAAPATSSGVSVLSGMPVSNGVFFGYITDIRARNGYSWTIVFEPVTIDIDGGVQNRVEQSYELIVDGDAMVEWQVGVHVRRGSWDQEFADEVLRLNADDPDHEQVIGYEIVLAQHRQVTYLHRYTTGTVWSTDKSPCYEPDLT